MAGEDALYLLFQRRSIRHYEPRPVEPAKVELLLKAAMAAPSACNNQPWEFVVVTEPAGMDAIREELPMARYNAPMAIAVCGNTRLCPGTKGLWVLDCSAALQNILLAATALGLGSVWIGVHGVAPFVVKVQRLLGLPDHVEPLGIAYVGYAAEAKDARTQYNAKRIYQEIYNPERKHRARPKNLKHL